MKPRYYRRNYLKLNKVDEMKYVDEFPDVLDQDHIVKDTIMFLEQLNYQIAELQRIKESKEQKLRELLNHEKEGAETYVCGRFKATITTGWNYTLDKKKYEEFADLINPKFNPVQEVVKL
jgi:hypothetical protein